MVPSADYPPLLKEFNPIRNMAINGTTRKICYNQIIYDDSCWESNELFGLTLVAQDGSAMTTIVNQQFSSAVVTIVNDDCELCTSIHCSYYTVT